MRLYAIILKTVEKEAFHDLKKIIAVFGTRPEAIKMCPVIIELKKRKDVDLYVCITGQHREMLRSVLDIFGVNADCDFNIMKSGQTLFDITFSITEKLKAVLEQLHNRAEKEKDTETNDETETEDDKDAEDE